MTTLFMNMENYRNSRLVPPNPAEEGITAYETEMKVLSGHGDSVFPDAPFALTLTQSLTLNYLQQSERVKVIYRDPLDHDHYYIIRNFDNPTNTFPEFTVNGAYVVGNTVITLDEDLSSLVNGNQVIINGENYALVDHDAGTITITAPGLLTDLDTGTKINIAIPYFFIYTSQNIVSKLFLIPPIINFLI